MPSATTAVVNLVCRACLLGPCTAAGRAAVQQGRRGAVCDCIVHHIKIAPDSLALTRVGGVCRCRLKCLCGLHVCLNPAAAVACLVLSPAGLLQDVLQVSKGGVGVFVAAPDGRPQVFYLGTVVDPISLYLPVKVGA